MALVVLLRGVNVGGHRTFRPAQLARQLEHLDAVNIGAAGTLVVRKAIGVADLRREIARRLPFETEIMVCPGREIARLVAGDLFAGGPQRPDMVRFVTVLASRPRSAPSLPMSLPAEGTWLLRVLAREGRYLVGEYRRQMRAVGYLGRLDGIFGLPATTRSWSTMVTVAGIL